MGNMYHLLCRLSHIPVHQILYFLSSSEWLLEFKLITLLGVMSTQLLLLEVKLVGSGPFIIDIAHLFL